MKFLEGKKLNKEIYLKVQLKILNLYFSKLISIEDNGVDPNSSLIYFEQKPMTAFGESMQ